MKTKDKYYRCSKCGKNFKATGEDGERIPQRKYMVPGHRARIGDMIFYIPTICYACQQKVTEGFKKLIEA
jgi:hypothetical protein